MQTETITVEKIHADFYGAEERLFVEAVGLSKGSLVNQSDKAARLKKLGFDNAAPIKADKELAVKREVSGRMVNCIEYFRTYYPHHKFITEAEVKKLCEKYTLLLGDVGNYVGDVPEKNIKDIENFKLRKEDWREKVSFSWFDSPRGASELIDWFRPSAQPPIDEYGQLILSRRQSGRSRNNSDLIETYRQLMLATPPKYVVGIDPYKESEKKKEYEQPAFKICAPKEDFNTAGYVVHDGYRLFYDPIVLQPVSKEGIEGYLIVTAWGGPEASDELVTNPISN